MGWHRCRNVWLLIASAVRSKTLGWYIVIRRLWLACRQTDSKKSNWERGDSSEQYMALVMSLNPNLSWVGGAMNESGHTCTER